MEPAVRSELDKLVGEINSTLCELREALQTESAVSQYKGYAIEKKQDVRLVTEQKSLKHTINTLLDFDCVSPDNAKQVTLSPGFIAMEHQKIEALGVDELIERVNQSKSNLELFLQFYNKPKQVTLPSGPVVKLNPILFEAYPMTNPTQLLRKVQFVNKPVEKVHFKWQKRQRYDKKTIEEAINIAKFNMDKPPALEFSTQVWSTMMLTLIDKLTSLDPKTILTRIKPSPYTPQLALKCEGIKAWKKHHGTTPIILTVNSGASVALTSELCDLVNAKKVDSVELASLGWLPVSKELGLYIRD